jgi:hypothetical protein
MVAEDGARGGGTVKIRAAEDDARGGGTVGIWAPAVRRGQAIG